MNPLAGREQLRPVFRDHVAPCFFKLYPEGKIAILRYHDRNDDAAALQRLLYAGALMPLQELKKDRFAGIRTLQDWHLNSVITMGPLLIECFNFLFYPFVSGSRGGPGGLDFLFLFEPAEKYTPALFPRNWLAAGSSAASFGKEQVDFYETIQNLQGPAWKQAAHQRFQHDKGYSVADRLALLEWYVGRINRLHFELTDVANFTEGRDPEAAIDPIFAFEHHLTVDRLVRKTLLSMTLEEVGTAKHFAFEVAEMYDGMSHLFGNHADASSFFKRLFNPIDGPLLLRSALSRLPAPFGHDLSTLADRHYRRIEDAVIDSVWLRSKVTPQGVLVRTKKDLSQEELMPRSKFVAELMRAYRNAHHGYFTDADDNNKRPSRFLFMVDGNLPVEIASLPALWWLAYVADPENMVGWQHLPINAFD